MLNVFPTTSLDSSILTSVLIGLLVIWGLRETLGWNASGLVVPGYLASLLVFQPVTAAVITVEAIVTFGLVRLISDRVPAWWPYTPLFGRDRFFLVLLLSVAVRLALEGGGLALVRDHLGLSVGISSQLHSMGLVVVPLFANALWRVGLAPGLQQMSVSVLLTWAALSLLLGHTNLSLASFELAFEDVALDFVSKPRAYILLLVGAYLGSVANLRWGWDFGGIIVPGLLALCWVEPQRVVTTLVEAGVISALVRAALQLPALRTANVTGGRPLVLAFSIAYLVKFALTWTLGPLYPGYRIQDLFGFGYLLPSLMALRAVNSGDVARTLIPAAVTSFGGFVVGSALGYGLLIALPPPAPPLPAPPPGDLRPARLLVAAWGGGATDAWLADGHEGVDTSAYGVVEVLGGGAQIAVSARVGPPGMGAAAIALADALDARLVHLCGPDATGCDEARRRLAARHAVLVVAPGDETRLLVGGRLPEGVDLDAIGALLGDIGLAPATGSMTLVIDEAARRRAAAHLIGAAPGPLAALRPLGPVAADPERLAPARLRAVEHEVLRPWLSLSDEATPDHAALRSVAGHAALLGLTVLEGPHRSALVGPDWYAVADRRGSPLIVRAPFALAELGADGAATALWTALDARLLIVDAPPSSPLGSSPLERPAHALLTAAVERDGAQAGVVSVRVAPDVFDPGAEIVVSTGRPLLRGDVVPPLVAQVEAALDASGFSRARYDGSLRRDAFHGGAAAARALGRAATGGEAHVSVFVSSQVVDAWAPLDTDRPLGWAAP